MEEYREIFKNKHSFNDIECDSFSDIDIMFDIEMNMPIDVFSQWKRYVDETGYKLFSEWVSEDRYVPENIDKSGMESLKEELNGYVNMIENSFKRVMTEYNKEDYEND